MDVGAISLAEVDDVEAAAERSESESLITAAELERQRLRRPSATSATSTICAPSAQMRICVRARPTLEVERQRIGRRIPGATMSSCAQHDYEAVVVDDELQRIHVLSESRGLGGAARGGVAVRSFDAHTVFGSTASTADIFRAEIAPLVGCVEAGGMATVVAYGATGAGKTHTMQQLQELCSERLCAGSAAKLCVSFFELIGERASDLLAERTPLVLREDGAGGVHVTGLTESVARSMEEVRALLTAGNAARATRGTQSNASSSRSHAICMLRLVTDMGGDAGEGGDGGEGGEGGATAARGGGGSLRLVDLAGSERRTDAVGHEQVVLQETRAINASLAALKECIRARLHLRQRGRDVGGMSRHGSGERGTGGGSSSGGGGGHVGVGDVGGHVGKGSGVSGLEGGEDGRHVHLPNPRHVPYRRSKLTMLLRSCFVDAPAGCASERTCFLAHVGPMRSAGQHTLSTLGIVEEMVSPPRVAREFHENFNEVEKWPASKVVAWVEALNGGKHAHCSTAFNRLSGKQLSCEYIVDVIKWVEAAGGSETDGHAIYDAFRALLAEAKRAKRAAAHGRGGGRRPPLRMPMGEGEADVVVICAPSARSDGE